MAQGAHSITDEGRAAASGSRRTGGRGGRGWEATDGRRRRKSPLGWLPWVALALLAALVAGSFLVARNAGDEGDRSGLDVTDDTSGGAGSGGDSTGAGSASGGGGSAPAGGQTGGGGSLTAGGQGILPVPASGLAGLTGQPVQGLGVRVESVVADEGFWVGRGPQDRVFVFLTPQARAAEGESPFQVRAGQTVDLTGTLRPVPQDITPFGVDAGEGADQLRQQGQYVEATAVKLSGG